MNSKELLMIGATLRSAGEHARADMVWGAIASRQFDGQAPVLEYATDYYGQDVFALSPEHCADDRFSFDLVGWRVDGVRLRIPVEFVDPRWVRMAMLGAAVKSRIGVNNWWAPSPAEVALAIEQFERAKLTPYWAVLPR